MTKKQINKEREAFIAWAKNNYLSTAFRYMEEHTKEFDSPFTANAFRGWLARAAADRRA